MGTESQGGCSGQESSTSECQTPTPAWLRSLLQPPGSLSVQIFPAVILLTRYNLHHILHPSETRMSVSPSLHIATRYTQVLEGRESHEYTCLFSGEEQSTLPSPIICVQQEPYLLLQYVEVLFGHNSEFCCNFGSLWHLASQK